MNWGRGSGRWGFNNTTPPLVVVVLVFIASRCGRGIGVCAFSYFTFEDGRRRRLSLVVFGRRRQRRGGWWWWRSQRFKNQLELWQGRMVFFSRRRGLRWRRESFVEIGGGGGVHGLLRAARLIWLMIDATDRRVIPRLTPSSREANTPSVRNHHHPHCRGDGCGTCSHGAERRWEFTTPAATDDEDDAAKRFPRLIAAGTNNHDKQHQQCIGNPDTNQHSRVGTQSRAARQTRGRVEG